MDAISFAEIEGLSIGHAHDRVAATGCTVVIHERGAATGVDVRGGAPATRETDLLNPVNLVDHAHAILIAGGSAFGLDAAAGVMRHLESQGVGYDVGVTKVPIVCGAALFDLSVGGHEVRPDAEMGRLACLNAGRGHVAQGSVGAGTGASVGKILGISRAMKGGIGTYAVRVGDLKVGAIMAVNCLGDVIDPDTGRKLAGLLDEDRRRILDSEEVMIQAYADRRNLFSGNTSIGVVATNAAFSKAQATKIASMAHDGLARTMRPAHSMYDGDTIFAMSTGGVSADLSVVGTLAARVVERAVVSAVTCAESLAGLPSHSDLFDCAAGMGG